MRLKEFRKQQNMSTGEMSSLLQISKSQYYKLEEGYKKPSFELMERFCKAFPQADIRLVFFESTSGCTSR